MTITIENITKPGAAPEKGNWVRITNSVTGSIVEKEFHPIEASSEQEIARAWRDSELLSSDWIVPVTDHPQHAAYKTYRQKLRDWPSTSDFPNTKPELGS